MCKTHDQVTGHLLICPCQNLSSGCSSFLLGPRCSIINCTQNLRARYLLGDGTRFPQTQLCRQLLVRWLSPSYSRSFVKIARFFCTACQPQSITPSLCLAVKYGFPIHLLAAGCFSVQAGCNSTVFHSWCSVL